MSPETRSPEPRTPVGWQVCQGYDPDIEYDNSGPDDFAIREMFRTAEGAMAHAQEYVREMYDRCEVEAPTLEWVESKGDFFAEVPTTAEVGEIPGWCVYPVYWAEA